MNSIIKKNLFFVFVILFLGCSSSDDTCICGAGEFVSTIDDINSIEGELFLPSGTGPFPVLIIVPGSGNEPREVLLPFTDIITSSGYAAYIYDKRGVGQSTGSYPIERIEDPTDFLSARANDVLAIINTLENHEDIDDAKIGLFSSSQGTWVSTLVFDSYPNLSYIVFGSGGVIPTAWEYYYDTTMLNHPDLSVIEGNALLDDYNGPLGFDARPFLPQMEFPILFILGGQDRSHPTYWEIDFVESLGKSNIVILFYENLNHSLVDENGNPDPNLISEMTEWFEALQ